MIVILEGTDGVGKTTLAKSFAQTWNAKYFHARQPQSDNWHSEYVDPLYDIDGHAVLDRWHLGEIVWPAIWDRTSLFADLDEFKACCHELSRFDVTLYVVVRHRDDIAATLLERGEEDTIADSLRAQSIFVELAKVASRHMSTMIVNSDAVHGAVPWS